MAVGIGPTAKANGQQSVAVGNSVEASGNFSVAIGTSAHANAAQTVALGNNANAAGEDALAIGRSANAQAKDSIAFGRSSQADAKGVAIGSEASAAVANSVALGSGTTAIAAADQSGTKNVNGLNYTYVGNSANSSVTVGNRQIKQVGAGEVSATSADAINGSQLYATQNVIGNIGKGVATNLGGGAALKSDGTFTAPTYNLTDASGNAVAKNNVGDALDVLNSRMNTVGTPVALNSNPSTGQVAAPTAADANKAATAGSVATAVNNAVSALESKGLQIDADSGTVDTVALGETVKYAGDANIKTKVTDNQIGFSLADNLNVTSITTGDSKLDATGLTITGGPSVTKTGINAGGKTITNVAAGTVSATSTDAATGSQLHKIANSTATHLGGGSAVQADGSISAPTYALTNASGAPTNYSNVGDALTALNARTNAANAGWKFQVNSGAEETIKPNDTVGFKDGTNIAITNNGKDLTIATNPNLTADSLTINNGPVINGNGINTNGKNIDMGNNGKITNLADGSIAAGSKDAITGGQLHTALNNISNAATNLIGTTQPDIVTYDVSGNKADNTNNVKQAIDKMNNGGIKFFHVNDGTGTQTTAGTQPATEDSSASGRYGAAVGYQAKASGESGVAIGKGAQATAKNTISIGTGNIVSGEGSGAIGDPTTITGAGTYTIGNNNGTVSANDAGAFGNDNTLTGHNSRIIGNHNIVNTENTFVVGNNVSRATANSVVLGNNSSTERVHTTATTPGSNYTFGGLNDANVAGVNNVVGVVSVGQGAAGSDASVETRQIQNVAAGVVSATSTDAINGSQLYHTNQAILNGVNGNLANLGARIGQVEDAANAGTAAAMAMAGLPQAYLPGKSMMAVGGSVYRGESGYAIGYSTISDGGNWIIKGTATGNSRGHYGATAAVGYQW